MRINLTGTIIFAGCLFFAVSAYYFKQNYSALVDENLRLYAENMALNQQIDAINDAIDGNKTSLTSLYSISPYKNGRAALVFKREQSKRIDLKPYHSWLTKHLRNPEIK